MWCRTIATRRKITTCAFSSLSSTSPAFNVINRTAEAIESFQRVVTPTAMQQLLHNGYCILHNVFPSEYVQQIRQEMQFLQANGQLYPNSTHIVHQGGNNGQTLLLKKHNILETELVLPEIRDQVPTLRDFFDKQIVFAPLQQQLPHWLGLSNYMVKLQCNEGNGGCFPLHFDSYGDDGKCITAVLYLNDEWKEGDGGEMVLYPFPRQERVMIPPRCGDMVLFSSQQMLHRVLPAMKPRYCLTTWIYHAPPMDAKAQSTVYYRQLQSAASRSDSTSFTTMMEKVLASSFRRHLMKLFYEVEWSQSLQESHFHTDAFELYLTTQERELEVIQAATDRMLQNFRLKDAEQPSRLPKTSQELAQRLLEVGMVQNLQIPWF